MPHYTAIVTLLAIALYFGFALRVAAARGQFGIKHPATTGNPDFERIRKQLRRPLLVDGRNLYDPDRMKALGFEYHGIGRGGR